VSERASSSATRRSRPAALRPQPSASRVAEPLAWSFDGPLVRCLADIEDTLRRVLVQLGDVGSVAVRIDVSLPALKQRVASGDALQPAWGDFMARLARRYGLPVPPRVRATRTAGPLFVLVVAYRS
jgi:hypothetical protein